jgi:hypothetical protein
MHFVSTRGLPAPRVEDLGAGLNDHGEVVMGDREFSTTAEQLSCYHRVAKRLGRYARSRAGLRNILNEHLSFTNSACFEQGRKKGGRATYVGSKFAIWANEVMVEDRSGTTIFGTPYETRQGKRRFQTMCRKVEDFLPDNANVVESDNTFDIDAEMFFTDFKFEDRIYGLDNFTGYQLLQWAFEEAVRTNVLSKDGGLGKRHPSVRVVPIGEPGGKTRTITVGEAWLNQYLAPFGHAMVGALGEIPQAKAGLSAAAMAYEWCKRLSNLKGVDAEPDENKMFLTSDLTQASEYLEHSVTRKLLQGFCAGFGMSGGYVDSAVKLLTSPRVVEYAEGNFDYHYTGGLTKRGSLMGEEGTKGALMLTMVVAEEIAYLKYCSGTATWKEFLKYLQSHESKTHPRHLWRCFAAAGDDHCALGPLDYLRGIKTELSALGAVVSLEKSFISKIGLYFTEEMILRTTQGNFEHDLPFWKVPYTSTFHVDAVKIRLLSPCSSVTLVREEKNPALGKCRQFFKKLSWLPRDFRALVNLSNLRFRFRVKGYLPWDNPMINLPPWLGGLGIPFLEGEFCPEKYTTKLLEVVPQAVLKTIADVISGTANMHAERALWLFSSNSTYRGITSRTLAEEQLRVIFSMQEDTKMSRDDFKSILEIDDDRWLQMRSRDQIRMIEQTGYISLHSAVQLFERPTYFKEVMCGLSTLLNTDNYYLRYQALEQELDKFCAHEGLSRTEFTGLHTGIGSIFADAQRDWFNQQMRIETSAFKTAGTLGVPVDIGDRKGFNSTPMQHRLPQMQRIITRHASTVTVSDDDVSSLQKWVDTTGESLPNARHLRTDEIFIAKRRIAPSLCTLSTSGVITLAKPRDETFGESKGPGHKGS